MTGGTWSMTGGTWSTTGGTWSTTGGHPHDRWDADHRRHAARLWRPNDGWPPGNGVDDHPRAVVEHARDRQLMPLLELPDRALGRGSEAALFTGDGQSDPLQLSLEICDVGAFHAPGQVAIRHGVLPGPWRLDLRARLLLP